MIMAGFANGGPQTGVLKLLVHQVHVVVTTHPRVSLNLQIPFFNHLECFREHTYFFS